MYVGFMHGIQKPEKPIAERDPTTAECLGERGFDFEDAILTVFA